MLLKIMIGVIRTIKYVNFGKIMAELLSIRLDDSVDMSRYLSGHQFADIEAPLPFIIYY